VKQLWLDKRLDVICIQETKMKDRDDKFWKSQCDNVDIQFAQVGVINSAGSVVTIWRTSAFVVKQTFTGNGIVGVEGIWKDKEVNCLIINIYSPCSFQVDAFFRLAPTGIPR